MHQSKYDMCAAGGQTLYSFTIIVLNTYLFNAKHLSRDMIWCLRSNPRVYSTLLLYDPLQCQYYVRANFQNPSSCILKKGIWYMMPRTYFLQGLTVNVYPDCGITFQYLQAAWPILCCFEVYETHWLDRWIYVKFNMCLFFFTKMIYRYHSNLVILFPEEYNRTHSICTTFIKSFKKCIPLAVAREAEAHRADNRYFNNDTAGGKQCARGGILLFPDVSSTLHFQNEWFNINGSDIYL